MNTGKLSFTSLLVVTAFFFYTKSEAQSGYSILKVLHVGGVGGWDYVAVNENRLYLSHGTQVQILDKNSGDSLGVIPNTNGVHGIAFIRSIGKGYTSNGRSNNVTVFDLADGKVLSQIATGQNPDAIMYESFSNKIITCNGRSNDLSIIDPSSEKVVATIPVGGKPETAVSNGSGLLYVNIEDKNEVAVIDLPHSKVLKRFSLSPAEGPTGLANDLVANRLFVGCEKNLMVLDATSGKIVARIPIGEGCDGVAFEAKNRLIFTSNGVGTLSIIQEKSPDQFVMLENLPTKRSARTVTLDPQTDIIYVPAADLEASAPGTRPAVVPGSFQVLVVGKSKK